MSAGGLPFSSILVEAPLEPVSLLVVLVPPPVVLVVSLQPTAHRNAARERRARAFFTVVILCRNRGTVTMPPGPVPAASLSGCAGAILIPRIFGLARAARDGP